MTSIKFDILQDIFGDECKKERGIIDSETTDEFLAKVESVSNKWDKVEEDITGKTPQFSRYFQRNIQDDMLSGMVLPVHRRAALNDEFFYNNAQESSNFVYKSKIKEKKVVEGSGYRPDPKCTWSEAITVYGNLVKQSRRYSTRSSWKRSVRPFTIASTSSCNCTDLVRDEQKRKRHLATLGTSVAEETGDENRDEPIEQQMVIGSFTDSGLPEFLRGSWNNANKIVQLDGIGSFPNDNSRRIVISLSKPLPHTVQIAGKKLACLECPRYNECGSCAHTLAAAHHLGMLSDYVKSYQVPLDRMVGTTIPSGAGKKDNERKNARKQRTKPPRDVAQYKDRINAVPSSESDAGAPYKVIFVRDTKATTCYGCKGRVRHKASDPPPPPPHDIFLHHMERRVYKRRGETKIHITTTPELVFYHPLRSCAPTASRDSIHIDEAIQCKLAESNKQLLWREFGILF